MKSLVFLAVFISQICAAQGIERLGELLRNEISASEINKQELDLSYLNKNYRKDNSQAWERNMPHYQWNQNYGFSDIFLRIPERGYFTVIIGEQMIGSASGKFRFLDLIPGNQPISIFKNGFLVYKTYISTRANTRSLLDFFTSEGLYLLGVHSTKSHQYAFDDWAEEWGDTSANYGAYRNVMNTVNFNHFINTIEHISAFDDEKLAFVNQQIAVTNFTANQIKAILNLIRFDDKKIDLAKRLYPVCVDKNNFYVVYDAFTFDSEKRKLMDFIAKTRN